ncbi:Uncharacterised protein [Xylophilus ampelinus]|nr:Uncharacterised protein [Xylophilus ampelinus]
MLQHKAGFSPASFLATVVKLCARDGNIAVIPEAARFASGRKHVLRIVIPTGARDEYIGEMTAVGVFATARELAIEASDGSWSTIGGEASPPAAPRPDSGLVGLYLARDAATSRAVASADAEDSGAAGELFGYPACCVAAVGELGAAAGAWPQALVERSGSPDGWSAAANRIVADWGAVPPVGELFPCSLACSHAIRIGHEGHHALASFGLHRLAQRIRDEATRGWLLSGGRARPSTGEGAMALAWR